MRAATKKEILEKLDGLTDFVKTKVEESGQVILFNIDLVRIGEIRNLVEGNLFSTKHAKEMNEIHRKYKLSQNDNKYIEILKTKGKIHAIKEHRANNDTGLRESKNYIDDLVRKYN